MTLQKDAAVELRNRLTNLYDATLAVIATYLDREGRRINDHYLEIDLCECGGSVAGPVSNDPDEGYHKADIQIVGLNESGVYFIVVREDGESEIYNREEAISYFTLDQLVTIAEELERIVTDNE